MGAKILVVDDEETNLKLAGMWLEDFGYVFDHATNGQEAVNKYMSGNYSIILMDVEMHIMDGFEATQLIRKYEKSKNLKPATIIALTSHGLIGDEDKCLKEGMDDYIAKPINRHVLYDRLAKYYNQ